MKIAVLLSGGVDSSVALRLLHEEGGHELHAFYLKVWLEDELAHLGACPWQDDLRYARAVCAAIGVPLEAVSLQRAYHRRVVRRAVDELAAGRTPSPDVLCNQTIKFGAFFDLAEQLLGGGFDAVASGHYARLRRRAGGRLALCRAVDAVKDQTYFLHRLDQRQLARVRFPLGALTKPAVRARASAYALPTAERPDSQGICFLGKLRFDDFVRAYLGERPGDVVELGSGRRLGRHRGPWFHTIGQRKGLGLGGGPWYVVAKDLAANVVYVAHRRALDAHRRDRFRVPRPHWIGAPPADARLEVKIRHSPETLPCRVRVGEDGGLEVELAGSDPGLADGQAAVFYTGEVCLGGGWIAAQQPSAPA